MPRTITTALLLVVLLSASATGEEARTYTIGHKLVKSQILSYAVKDTKKTLVTDPETQQAIIVTMTSSLDARRIVYDQQGIWVRTVEMSAFKDLVVDEATGTGIALDAEEVQRQKMAELKIQRLDSEIFNFSTISEFGQPDPAKLNSDDLKTVLNGSAGTIAFLPPSERKVGDTWFRDITIGINKIRLVYSFDSVTQGKNGPVAEIRGEVEFPGVTEKDELGMIREFSFGLSLDTATSTIIKSTLTLSLGLMTEGKVITRSNIISRELKSSEMLDEAKLAATVKELDQVKIAQDHLARTDYDKAYEVMKPLLKSPESIFAAGYRVFVRDRIFIYWKVEGRMVDEMWLTEYINSQGLKMADTLGNAMVIAFFDPEVSSSTRIWRPFDDWAENFSPKGLKLLAISAADPDKVRKYIAELEIKHAVGIDHDAFMLNFFQVDVVPTFFVLDRQGRIVLKQEGKRDLHVVHKKLEEFYGVIPE